jgi:hypothetical protein
MARGRKRLIAGWGLVGAGAASLVAIAVSSQYGYGVLWVTGNGNVRTHYGFSISRGGVTGVWRSIERVPDGKQPDPLTEKLWSIPSDQRFHVEQKTELVWWLPFGIGIADFYRSNASMFPRVRVVNGTLVLWPVTALTLVCGLPLLLHARHVAKRNRPGLCPACGYDMKGLAAGAGCPECGKAAAESETPQGSSKVAGGTAPGDAPR